MKKAEEMVMFDSQEAAQKVTMVGWKSRNGYFYPGDNQNSERGARWSGCTHMICACGNVHEKGRTMCSSCIAKKDTEKYYAMPMVEWDEVTPVCTDGDKFFFDVDSVLEHMAEVKQEGGDEAEVQIVLCEPGKLHLLSDEDWCDDLPEDGELPDDVQVKLNELNKALADATPVCWYPGKKRINMAPLWEQLRQEESK